MQLLEAVGWCGTVDEISGNPNPEKKNAAKIAK
jgi:hypothetical protein